MKLALQLAYRNLVGAGLRTWLNVAVLSFSFVMILFFNGILDGWNQQARIDTINWDYGYGHLMYHTYDPYDPFTLQDGHGPFPAELAKSTSPILIQQGSIYPNGRMLPVLLKGITPDQTALKIPTTKLARISDEIPVVIGSKMASNAKLDFGDKVLLRWRDAEGTFDAAEIVVAHVFDCNVPSVDNGQIWISLEQLQKMTGLEEHATMAIAHEDFLLKEFTEWKFISQKELLADLDKIISTKRISGSIMYLLLLAIALLALFDTQVLSIFRRQKEIGTYISLGMTRWQVIGLFTTEGTMYSILATAVGCIWGIPLLWWLSNTGITIPEASQEMGISIADRIYPVYGMALLIGTLILIVISATIVSFIPARKIARMNVIEALKGKIQ